MNKLVFILLLAAAGCTWVGNSPEELKHRRAIQQQEETFNRQIYERRYAPAVEETEAFFVFTNRLSQRDTEPMDLAELGRVMVQDYGTNVTWRVVTTAYADYSGGAPLGNASNVIWLAEQNARTRDTAWLLNFREEWNP